MKDFTQSNWETFLERSLRQLAVHKKTMTEAQIELAKNNIAKEVAAMQKAEQEYKEKYEVLKK